ncbi:MAG: hypothetical protein NVS4B13_01230 [Candidatus Elarobacter sp.]
MTMEFTGERFVPSLKGQIYYEHLHRYAIAARFCAGKRVLDIASGEGYGAALLAQRAAQVIGVDLDERSVEHARRAYYAANLRFMCGSVTDIPLADASIDVVSSFETIEHVAEHDRMLDEIRRVLVPGGVVVLSSPNKLIYSDVPGFANPFHVKELYFSELRDLLMRRFAHVALYGQRLSASSVVHPLAGVVSELASWYNGSVDRIAPGLPALSNPVYFVAVCSDEPLSIDVSSAYVDPGDDLLEDIWNELNTLRHQAALANHGPTPALPRDAELSNGSVPVLPAHVAGAPGGERSVVLEAELDGARDELARERSDREAELARVRSEHEAELGRARAERDGEFERVRAEYMSEIAQLRERFEAETAQLGLACENREASLQEQVAVELERSRTLHRELDDARIELRRARDAVATIGAELHEERQRCARLMEHAAEMRAREENSLPAGAQRERAADEAFALLRNQVVQLTEALHRAAADSHALREVLSSRSWKLTSPLRRAVGIVRR